MSEQKGDFVKWIPAGVPAVRVVHGGGRASLATNARPTRWTTRIHRSCCLVHRRQRREVVLVRGHPGVEHPQRDVDASGIKLRGQTAVDNGFGMTAPLVVDPDLSAKPRMPAIANYSRLGTMGIPLMASTTPCARTRRWTHRPRTSTTSRRCRRCTRQHER